MYKRDTYILIILFLLIGLALFILYKDMPLVRNSLVYARIIFNIDDLGSNFIGVEDGYNKPLGFAYLSYPFYKIWNATIAMKIISSLATAAWGISIVYFFKRFAKYFDVNEKYLNMFILITLFNPLVLYQFVSAYPDMLYALTFLWSIYFLDRIFSEDLKWFDGILFSLWVVFSIWVKHNGFIIIPILIIFLIGKRNLIKVNIKNKGLKRSYIIALISLIIALGIIAWGYLVENPVFNFGQNAENFLREDTNRFVIILINIFFVLIFFIFTVNVFALFTKIKVTNKNRIWMLIVLIFVLSLLFYHGTKYNIRYYTTILPFLNLYILAKWQDFGLSTKKVSLTIFLIVSVLLNLYYNTLFFHNFVSETLVIPKLDNLRLTYEQAEALDNIKLINEISKKLDINKLYFISSYYADSSHTVWERENEFNENIKIEYYYHWDEVRNKSNKVIIFDNYRTVTQDKSIEEDLTQLSDKVYLLDVRPSLNPED